jgi:Retron-type reverse transcriptase
MNVTKDGFKDRQLHIEDYLQVVSAEQKEHAEVSVHQRIAENNDIITNFHTDGLLERILHRDNLNNAYKKVKSNKGAGGVDGMSVDELLTYLKDNQKQLIQKIRDGKYKPNPVRRVEIPKEEKGKVRELGIPTVVDRVIQQAITQVLSPIFERQFSDYSFGFRPGRGAHDALKQCQQNVDDGYVYVVDMDLEKFFDTVCQSKLIEVLSRTIKDGGVISLIHKYLNAGVVQNGLFERTEVGVPQGGPLSPLLSNIMLNELDKELNRRGHRFVRYADDCMIFCKSRKSAERTLENIVPYIEGKLFLKVNSEKTEVAYISKIKYLGYAFYRHRGRCRLRVHPKSIAKMKNKVRELTARSNGWGNEYRALKLTQFVRGWVNYFTLADMKHLLRETDEWLRHKIRTIYWRQWKKTKTKFINLKKLGAEEEKAWICANMRNGHWYCGGYFVLQTAFNNKKLRELGYPTFTEQYLKICEN